VIGSTVTRTSGGMTTLAMYVSSVPGGATFVNVLTTAGEPRRLQRDCDARIVEVGRVRGGQLGASPRAALPRVEQMWAAYSGNVELVHEPRVHGPWHVDVPRLMLDGNIREYCRHALAVREQSLSEPAVML
jgi:hypothetical protein